MQWVFSPKQLLSMYWWSMESVGAATGIICDGAVRSGKTISLITGFLMWSMETFNGQTFGLCGKTIASFGRNVLQPMKRIVSSLGYSLTERKSDHAVLIYSPAGVRENRRFFLSSSGKPSACSSALICWEMADWEIWHSSAASEKLLFCTTA